MTASYTNIRQVYTTDGKYNKALVQLKNGPEINIRVLGCEHHKVVTMYNVIRAVYKVLDDLTNALLEFQKSFEIFTQVHSCDSMAVATSHNNIRDDGKLA